MSMFSNAQNEAKEAMVKYMEAFIELANLAPDVEKTDIAALHNLSMYIKDDCNLAPEVVDGYRAVYDRVYDMIFTEHVKRTPYVDYKTLNKAASYRGTSVLHSLVFDTYVKAANFCNTLIDRVSEYGEIAVGDVVDEYEKTYDNIDYIPTFYDYKLGWLSLPSNPSDIIVRGSGSWRVVLPKPAVLQ